MQRLIYGSTATGRTDNLMNLATLLSESRRNNERDGLTGALAAHDGRYLQVIEGPSGALDRLMRRLADDNRHRDLVVFSRESTETRLFTGWAMASARITPTLQALLDSLMSGDTAAPEHTVALLKSAIAEA